MSTTLAPAPTSTLVTYPIVAALIGAEKELGKDRIWRIINDQQGEFLRKFFLGSRGEVETIPEIETRVSREAETLNDFLRERGFSIQLDKFTAPDDFGVVSILELVLDWLTPGWKTSVRSQTDNKDYPAVEMRESISFFTVAGFNDPVAAIQTKTEDVVYLTVPRNDVTETELDSVAETTLRLMTPCFNYDKLVFPMIDLDMELDITWLQGMFTFDEDDVIAVIRQALQQTLFKMDEIGAIVKSAVAISAVRCSISQPKETFTIDKPFLAIVVRPSLKKPLFVGYLNTDCWAKPNR